MPPEPAVKPVQYVALPTQPAIALDVALLVPNAVKAAEIEQVIRATAGALLERLQVVDEFRGQGVPDGHRSLTWRLTFRHKERTLAAKEIENWRSGFVKALKEELGVELR